MPTFNPNAAGLGSAFFEVQGDPAAPSLQRYAPPRIKTESLEQAPQEPVTPEADDSPNSGGWHVPYTPPPASERTIRTPSPTKRTPVTSSQPQSTKKRYGMGTHCATVAFGLICFLAPNYGFSLTSNYEAKILALLMALVFLMHPYARTFFMQPKSCCDKKHSDKSNKNTFRKRYPWVELTAPTLCIITCFAASNHWAGLPLVQTLCQAGGAISLAVLFYAITSKLYQTYQYKQQKAAEASEAKEEHKGGASAKSTKEKIQPPIYYSMDTLTAFNLSIMVWMSTLAIIDPALQHFFCLPSLFIMVGLMKIGHALKTHWSKPPPSEEKILVRQKSGLFVRQSPCAIEVGNIMKLGGKGARTPVKATVIDGPLSVDVGTGQHGYQSVAKGEWLPQGTPLYGNGFIHAACTEKHQQKKTDKRMQSAYAEYNDYFASTVVLLSVGSAFGLYLGGWSIHDVLMTNMSLLMIACGCVFTLAENAADHMIHKTRHLKYKRDRDEQKTEEKFKAWCQSIVPVFISGGKALTTEAKERLSKKVKKYFGNHKETHFIDAQIQEPESQAAETTGNAAAEKGAKTNKDTHINIYYNATPKDKANIATSLIQEHPGFQIAHGDWQNDTFFGQKCNIFFGQTHQNNQPHHQPAAFGTHASISYDANQSGTVKSHKDHPGLLYGAMQSNPKKRKILCLFDLSGTALDRSPQPNDAHDAQEHKGLLEDNNTWLRYFHVKQNDVYLQAHRMVQQCYRFAMAYNVLAYSLIMGLALGAHQTLSPNLSALLMWVSLGTITCMIQYAQRQADKDNVPLGNNPSLPPQSHPILTRTQSARTHAEAVKQAAATSRAKAKAKAMKAEAEAEAEVMRTDTPSCCGC